MKKTFKFVATMVVTLIIIAVCVSFKIVALQNHDAETSPKPVSKEDITVEVSIEENDIETEILFETTNKVVDTTTPILKETTIACDTELSTETTLLETIAKDTIISETAKVETTANNTQQIIPKEPTFPLTYSDSTCTITIYKEWYKNAWCYAAHINFSDFSRFGTECANGKYNNGYETTSHCAKRIGAIFAVNGCYSAPYLNYTVIRNGIVWNGNDRESLCLPAVYSNRTGILESCWEGQIPPHIAGKSVKELANNSIVTDTFCFGPPNLVNGINVSNNNSSRAQRTFIGTNGTSGDIWVVVSDGRYNDGASAGLTGYETAEYLLSKGCTFGVNLDGGGSSAMYFNGQVLNANKNNERAVVDFLWFK